MHIVTTTAAAAATTKQQIMMMMMITTTKTIIIMMMMIIIVKAIVIEIVIVIMIPLKGTIQDFLYNLLIVQRTVCNTYAQVVREKSRANHVQHIGRSSCVTCRVQRGTKGQLSY